MTRFQEVDTVLTFLYQINLIGAVLPKDHNDVLKLMEYSQKNSIPLLARGGGSSQCGQTVSEVIVLDYFKTSKPNEPNVEEKICLGSAWNSTRYFKFLFKTIWSFGFQ